MPSTSSIARWAVVALTGVGLATAATLLAAAGWPFELFSHFRLQLAVAAVLLLLSLLLLRRPRAALLAAVLAGVHLVHGGTPLRAAERAPACAGPGLVVVTANLDRTNSERGRFLAWLAEHPADIVVAQEVTAAWARELESLRDYPYRRIVVREDPYGIAVLSRWPFETLEPVYLAGDGLPSLEGVAEIHGQRLHLLGLHTLWPVAPQLAARRDRALMRVAVMARATPDPLVAAGDLNLTPDSPAWLRLLEDSRLRDVFAGRSGWHPTWRAGFWPLALRIDHALVSQGVCVDDAQVGPEIGSDHRPVTVRLRLARGS